MTNKVDAWLDTYAESHQDSVNKCLHWLCVPTIALSIIGGRWSVPVPTAVANVSPLLNLGTAFMACSLIYYSAMSWPLAVTPLTLFAIARIGQFWGHWIEGKKPSFLKDMQDLMIGPLWMLAAIFWRLKLKY